ncbi:ribonucleotide-diphosphate reductase subunit beta [Bifidobacterium sp. ESL0745]|uniref:ribonucleotide-diphosphate reductase subunit beta n=1 Tax=Bifidobacterium sp. ESL0745 TaxID=2983226 RepID=UPI0023FA1DAE|nr:ribonucleotide-diphosphate reductase subunit beta [Bifidobacterium sp. ESL0745]MDF7665841.1 ribonucleotide-diphosphate reductase subunit beta [Bifidobacterium sp. ESL0745]
MTFTPLNWNLVGTDADTDRDAFNTMSANLWTPEQVSLADDAEDMRGLSETERLALVRIFAGLSSVESLQAGSATSALSADAGQDETGTRQAVLTAIAFGESIHTKAYSTLIAELGKNAGKTGGAHNTDAGSYASSIDSATADDTKNANDAAQSPFTWVQQNESMQEKLRLLNDAYATAINGAAAATNRDKNPGPNPDATADSANISLPTEIAAPNALASDSANGNGDDSAASRVPDLGTLKRLATAVLAEALVVQSGFYLPMWLSSHGTLTKSADIIRLINRDIVTSSSYLGAVYQRKLDPLNDTARETMRQYTYDLANNLYFSEEDYSYTLPYADLSLEDDTEKFLSHNANKALSYLGYPTLFPAEISQPNPAVIDELNDMESLTDTIKSGGLFSAGAGFASTNSASAAGAPTSTTSTDTTADNKAEETSDDDWDF